jgi:hypothetical protein
MGSYRMGKRMNKDNFETDYATKLEESETKFNLLLEQFRSVLKERDRYKKACIKLKQEKLLDYTEDECNTVRYK